MSSLILCHKQKATQPFKLPHIRYKIYTIEELAFVIFDNLYLMDHTLMSEPLCAWIEKELGLYALADSMREDIIKRVSLEDFILSFLAGTGIYSTLEINHIESVLHSLKGQEEVEKMKRKADDLLSQKEYENAILAYKSILASKRTEDVDAQFYGKVYGCLGCAYGRLFLYKEAAKAYSAAYQICDDYKLIKAYLYACRQYMSAEEYHLLLAENNLFKLADKENSLLIGQTERKNVDLSDESLINTWKEAYRGN